MTDEEIRNLFPKIVAKSALLTSRTATVLEMLIESLKSGNSESLELGAKSTYAAMCESNRELFELLQKIK